MYNTLYVSCAANMRHSRLLHIYHIGSFHSFLQFCWYKHGTQQPSECQCNQMLFYGEFTAIKRCCFRTQSANLFALIWVGTLERMPKNASRWGKQPAENKATENRGEKRHCRSRSVVLRQDHTHSYTHTDTHTHTSFVYSDTPQTQMYMRVRCPHTLSHTRQLRSRFKNIRMKRRAKRQTETLNLSLKVH